jgi:hypothetical protein
MGNIATYTPIRRDIVTAVTKSDKLQGLDKLIFLAIAAECHGMAYTTIDYKTLAKNWDVSVASVTRSVKSLEAAKFLKISEYLGNRTKQKSVAKYVDQDLTITGHDEMATSVIDRPDYLNYIHRSQGEAVNYQTEKASYLSDMLEDQGDSPTRQGDNPVAHTDSPVAQRDMPVAHTDSSTRQGEQLRRKEDKEKRRRDKTISLSPSENANPKDVIKDKVRSDQKWEKSSDLNHLKRMFSLVNGDEEYFKQLVDQATNGNQFYSEFKDDLERLITTLVKKRDAEKTNLLMGDLNNVSFDGIKIPENLRGLERNVWAYFMLYGDEEVKDEFEDLSTKNSHSRTPQVNVEQMINFINNNGTRFNR